MTTTLVNEDGKLWTATIEGTSFSIRGFEGMGNFTISGKGDTEEKARDSLIQAMGAVVDEIQSHPFFPEVWKTSVSPALDMLKADNGERVEGSQQPVPTDVKRQAQHETGSSEVIEGAERASQTEQQQVH
jgi:hypothetical protein